MTFEEDYKKAHKNLISTKGKRIIYLEELSEKKLNIELLKEYSDGKNIEVEIMYGTTEKINIGSKLFFCSNPTPNFKTDGGIANRYKQISFNSSFEESNTYDDYETFQFKQNNNLQDELKDDLNHALISLLIDYAYKYTVQKKIKIPVDFLECQKETLESNDEIKIFLDDNMEYDNDYRLSKNELEHYPIFKKLGFKGINDDLKRLGYKYQKDKRKNGHKGC